MDAAERMFRVLVRTISTRFPQYRVEPFTVEELQGTILPYRLHRRDLGLETNQDYETTLTELLSGRGGWLMVEERMRDVLTKELASPNPDLGAFRQFASTRVSLSPDAVLVVEQAPARDSAPPVRPTEPRLSGGGAPGPGAGAASAGAPAPSAPAAPAAPVAQAGDMLPASAGRRLTPAGRQRTVVVPPGATCAYCAGTLPTGREITFCPHCGQNLTVMRCDACGTELEVGWKFCTTCGKSAAR